MTQAALNHNASPTKKKLFQPAGLFVAGDDLLLDSSSSETQKLMELPPSEQALPRGRNTHSSSSVSLESNSTDSASKQKEFEYPSSEQREVKGLCLTCGKQLFAIKTKKKGLFKTKTEAIRVPLSIPGQVERGQCLNCTQQQQLQQQQLQNESPSSSIATTENNLSQPTLTQKAQSNPVQNNTGKAVYEGSYNVYGERDGKGTMTWENGDVYTGDFFNGNRHGHGTLAFADGSEYVGEWECNQQHGVGTRRWNNGDCYTGQYKVGKRTGEGRFYFANGDLYAGQWEDGVMQGFGRYYYSSGQRFEGNFVNGKRRGKGKLQRTDGSVDIGVYCEDQRFGVGVRWSPDRTVAWKMCDGVVKKKITVPEAVALDYDMDANIEAMEQDRDVV